MDDSIEGEIQLTLTLRHVPFLIERLSMHAYKWREIGTALQFQSQNLRNIEACPSLLATAPVSFMQRLVEEWLEGKYPHTAPPTLANLIKALNSHIVGLGTLATQIKGSLPQHNQPIDAKVFDIASVSILGDITFNWTRDITVSESAHVHLKVKINSETQKCKWSSTGLVPIKHNELLYSDIDKPALCIPKADIDMDGSQYSCVIKNYQTTRLTTPVTLRVNCPYLDQFKNNLTSIYLAQPEVPQDSWPPVCTRAYINLALVKQQKINYGEECAYLTIKGDMDDTLHHKEKIEYKNIFDEIRSGSLFLIEGRPGSGKTTLVYKITRDWAANEVHGPVRLLLLVSLRVLNSWKKPVNLEDILQLLNLRIEEESLNSRNGKGVCFIFDGLDEFSPLEGENSIVYKIINKMYLPKSIKIVTSRPAALVNLRQRADKVIEVIGFPIDQIFEFVNNYPFSKTEKIKLLKSYLIHHPNVLHVCYLPIHAAMVAFLFEVTGKVPRTETEMYTHFTLLTLRRNLSKHKGQHQDTELLSGNEEFCIICEHALEITKLNKQVLDQDEKVNLLLQNKGISLGLVTVDRTASLYGFKNIYTFLHLTYQEYLAAYHISTLSDEDQYKLIKQYGDIDHMQVVWKFYCGLVNFEGHEYKFKSLVSKRRKIGLTDIQFTYESQQKIVCNFLLKLKDQIMLEDKYLTTIDFTALGYLLANTSKPVSLSLIRCRNIGTTAVDAMLAESTGRSFLLDTLCCESHNLDVNSIRMLSTHSQSLEKLVLKDFSVRTRRSMDLSHTAGCWSHGIAASPIRTDRPAHVTFCEAGTAARVPNSVLGDARARSIPCRLPNDTNLPTIVQALPLPALVLPRNVLGLPLLRSGKPPSDSSDAAQGLPHMTHPSLIFAPIGHDSSSKLVGTSLANLEELSLTNVQVGPKTLAHVLMVCRGLESLILRGIEIASDGAALFAEELKRCSTLQEFEFSYSWFGTPEGIASVLVSLRNCTNIQKLNLSNTDIKTDGACVLASYLQHWLKLQMLDLSKCGIQEEGGKAIAGNIKYCPTLSKVELGGNDISTETLERIKSSLQLHNESSNQCTMM